MKKYFKIFIIMLFALSINITNASASEVSKINTAKFTINEYDTMLKEKLSESNAKTVNNIGIYEQLYLERAKESTKDLIEVYGYTEKQAQILKSYLGTPIEDTPELRVASATCTGFVHGVNCSTSQLGVKAEWSWSSTPLLCGPGITDGVALRWQGTDTGGNPLNLYSDNEYIDIKYVGTSGVTHRTVYPEILDPYNAVQGPVLMDNGYGTARSGVLNLVLKKTGTKSINEAAIIFTYAHCSILLNVGFSFPASFSINVTSGTQEFIETVRITSSGATIS